MVRIQNGIARLALDKLDGALDLDDLFS